MIYGMAVGGELGVARTVEMLKDELKTVMQLAGTQTTDQIDRTFIVRHGKEKDESLTLEAGSNDAKAWNGSYVTQAVRDVMRATEPVVAPILEAISEPAAALASETAAATASAVTPPASTTLPSATASER